MRLETSEESANRRKENHVLLPSTLAAIGTEKDPASPGFSRATKAPSSGSTAISRLSHPTVGSSGSSKKTPRYRDSPTANRISLASAPTTAEGARTSPREVASLY